MKNNPDTNVSSTSTEQQKRSNQNDKWVNAAVGSGLQ